MFPLLACYLPVIASGFLALLILIFRLACRKPSEISLLSAGLLGAYLFIRTLFGGDLGLRDFELLRLGGIFLFYLIFAVTVTESAPRIFFLSLILLSAFLQTSAELYQFYCDRSWEPLSLIASQLQIYYPTTVGTYANKNHLAWLLGDASLFALALGCWGRLRWTIRGLALYCAAFCSLGVFLSLSRGGVVALVVGMLVFSLLSFSLLVSSGNRVALLTGCIGALILSLLGVAVGGVISGSLAFRDRMQGLWMDVYREDLWRAAIHDLGLDPFFGMGAGSFQWSSRLMMPYESLLAHNDFAQLLSEYGLTGLLLVILFLVVHLWVGGKGLLHIHRADSESTGKQSLWSNKRAIEIGAISVAAAEIIHSFLDFNMHLGANSLLAGACFGVLCNSGTRRVRGDDSVQWILWCVGGVMALITFFLALIVASNWRGEKCLFAAEEVALRMRLISPSTGQLSSAIESALSASESSPSSGRAAAILANLLWFRITQQAYAEAQLSGGKETPSSFTGSSRQRDLELLNSALRRAVRADPGDWFTWMRLGGGLALIGDESGSRAAFTGAMQRLPLYALTYQEYAASLRDFGSLSEAGHYYQISSRFKDAGPVSVPLEDLKKLLREKGSDASRESDVKSEREGRGDYSSPN